MTFAKDTFLKILLRHNPPIEVSGYVVSWKKTEIELINEKRTGKVIIPSPDILMISVPFIEEKVVPKHQERQTSLPFHQDNLVSDELEDKFKTIVFSTSADRLKNLAQLKSAMNDAERAIMEDKLKTHVPSNPKPFPYLPSINE